MHRQGLALTLLLQHACGARTAPATASSKDMYQMWCGPQAGILPGKDPDSVLCQHHNLIGQVVAEKDITAKKELQKKLLDLRKTHKGTGSPFDATLKSQYQQMKLAFCATSPKGAKILCSTAASQYKTGSSLRGLAKRLKTGIGAAVSGVKTSQNDVMSWYCGKPANVAEQLCKRNAIIKAMHAPGTTLETRKTSMEQLKALPAAYGEMQAVYADYCKLEEHASTTTCTRLKMTGSSKAMRAWWCAKPTSTDSLWCKRQALLDKLQMLPATSTDPTKAAERKKLLLEFSTFSKRPAGGGPASSVVISREIVTAKKEYCAIETNKELTICSARALGRTILPFGGLSSMAAKGRGSLFAGRAGAAQAARLAGATA
tara:strand:- start:48 stop:1166 length:1119 start_codon:yes stop_codon:yes gene_type:complete